MWKVAQNSYCVLQSVRLAVADKERVEGSRAAASHAYYSQFTFQPAINPRSKQLIRVSMLTLSAL